MDIKFRLEPRHFKENKMGAFDDLIKQAMDPNNADKLADIIADINKEYNSLVQF